jgi:energy-coupling factor transporter transmembrane protein EcfT
MRTRLARWSWFLSLALCLGMIVPASSFGQDATAAAPAARANPMRVTAVRSNDPKHPNRAGLGDAVFLTVEGLGAHLDGDQDACGDLVLFLAEVPIPGHPPEACDPYTGQVRFLLDRTPDSDQAWHVLLAEPVSFTKKVEVSVGTQGRLALPTNVKDFELEIVPAIEFVGFLIGLLLAILMMAYLAKTTTLLRDRVPGLPAAQAPYSLSRFQLAFWSLLVIAAYLFIWLITQELDTITGSVLALLGIGSATALGATIIDQGKPDNPPASAPPVVEVPPGTVPSATPAVPVASRGFLNDVLSDDQGISIYRFQLFAWTLVLGVIFCASVYNGLAMPQFSTTLLGLMGISSGTYLGFKVPEKSANP